MRIYAKYDELLQAVTSTGRETEVLGHTPDGAPLIAVRCGGDKTPAVFITAGTHSTEHAGVSAAVQLIEDLDTEHQVYVIPSRDPIGTNPYAYALKQGLGELPVMNTFEDVEAILRTAGDVFFDEEEMVLALIGDYGYMSSRPSATRLHPQWGGYLKLQKLAEERPKILEPFKGRRLYMTPGQDGIEGTGLFGRAYTIIVGLDGQILHLNRFHDTAWAPIEPRVTRQLMARIQPGISFDLHESQLMQDRYWLSARHQADAENQVWEERVAAATMRGIVAAGGNLAEDLDVLGGVPLEETWFTRSEKAVYWLDANVRGEGLNLMDFASRVYGLAFGTEMGMYGRFEHRVKLGMVTVQAAVAEFEKRYR
jgi:hypothetical protein